MTDIKYTKLENYRYERKFKPSSLNIYEVRNTVLSSKSFFRKIYQPRRVNNIYLDTPQLDCFYDNVHGRADRKKYRIRWYGDLKGLVKNAIFEIKIKNAYRGIKRSFFLPDFTIDKNLSGKQIINLLKAANIPDDVRNEIVELEVKLLNTYRREYYRDLTGDFRLTIDSEILYYRLHDNFNSLTDNYSDAEVVVEIKYDEQYNDIAAQVINTMPFRMTRNSKYVEGIAGFYEVSL